MPLKAEFIPGLSTCTMAQTTFKMPIYPTKGANRLIRLFLGLFRALISNLCLFYI